MREDSLTFGHSGANFVRQHAYASSPAVELAISILLACSLTALPVGIHLISPALAFAATIASSIAVAWLWPRAIPIILLIAFGFQSSFVSMASSQVRVIEDLEPMKIYNFIIAIFFWLFMMGKYFNNYANYSRFLNRLILWSFAALILVGLFFIAGLLFNARGAAIYMRNIGLPIILFQTCLLVAAKDIVRLPAIAGSVLVLFLLCGYVEMFAVNFWFDLTNAWNYWDLAAAKSRESGEWIENVKKGQPVVTGILDLFKIDFLNTSLLSGINVTIVRLQGPNFHPISFGYALAILSSILLVHGRVLIPAFAIPLLFMASAKGAIILVVLSLGYCIIARRYRDPRLWYGLLLFLSFYIIVLVYLGMKSGDYHVLGLLGGINGFLQNPLGHTLGQGGNLSVNFATLDWSRYQAAGATDIAIESAAGVLLFQMGIAAFALAGMYLWLSKLGWALYRLFRSPALAWSSAAICITLANGFFQEEALFAPLSLGLILAIVGLTYGSIDRVVVSHGLADRRPFPGNRS